jgi:hypothetical protein
LHSSIRYFVFLTIWFYLSFYFIFYFSHLIVGYE